MDSLHSKIITIKKYRMNEKYESKSNINNKENDFLK